MTNTAIIFACTNCNFDCKKNPTSSIQKMAPTEPNFTAINNELNSKSNVIEYRLSEEFLDDAIQQLDDITDTLTDLYDTSFETKEVCESYQNKIENILQNIEELRHFAYEYGE